jgi:hypothetical protein
MTSLIAATTVSGALLRICAGALGPLVHVGHSASRPKRPEQGGDDQREVDGEQLDDASNRQRQGRVLSGGKCDYLAGLPFCRKLLASSCASCPDGSVGKRPQDNRAQEAASRTGLLWSYQLSRLTRQLSQPAFFRVPLNV